MPMAMPPPRTPVRLRLSAIPTTAMTILTNGNAITAMVFREQTGDIIPVPLQASDSRAQSSANVNSSDSTESPVRKPPGL